MSGAVKTRIALALPKGMWSEVERAAALIRRCSRVVVASHIDADGIAAASVAMTALERLGTRAEVRFFKKLDEEALESLHRTDSDLVWYTDLGSGSISKLEGSAAVVTDHHVPDGPTRPFGRNGQALLTDFGTVPHVNPHLCGLSGATEISGAGTTFIVASALGEANLDLAFLGVLGAVGDLQDQRTRRLEGLNRAILAAAEANGTVQALQDIRYFGRETRPVVRLLEYSSDPILPRITGDHEGALRFLAELGIELKEGDDWRAWADLSKAEKTIVIDALRDHLLASRRSPEVVQRLVGEVYVFLKEQRRSPLRDAKEFATLMNACGRHGKPELGMRICSGDRNVALAEGLALLRNHRSALSEALLVARDAGITRLKNIQFFDAGDDIEDTIIGTVAGMLLGSEGADRSAPIIAFANSREYSDPPKVKASGRGTQELVALGMDLSAAIRRAAERVGGVGGGHNIAAGATLPSDRKKDFLAALDEIVGAQITGRGRR